jgi:AraC-like DNA-binding protein
VLESLYQPFPMLPGRRAQAWRHHPAFRRPRHFHPEPELNVVGKGSALIGLGDRVVRLGAGGVILFHPGQDHVLLEASPDLELWVLALRADLAGQALDSLARAASVGDRLSPSALRTLEDTLAGLAQVSDAVAVETGTVRLFSSLQTHLSTNHVLSRRALEAASAKPSTPGAQLARRLGVDPSALSRNFHDSFGLTLVSYRARQRAMAFVRLVDSGQSLTRAAMSAGFGSYAQCHRVITKALGCSPNRYFAGERARIDDARIGAVK